MCHTEARSIVFESMRGRLIQKEEERNSYTSISMLISRFSLQGFTIQASQGFTIHDSQGFAIHSGS